MISSFKDLHSIQLHFINITDRTDVKSFEKTLLMHTQHTFKVIVAERQRSQCAMSSNQYVYRKNGTSVNLAVG